MFFYNNSLEELFDKLSFILGNKPLI